MKYIVILITVISLVFGNLSCASTAASSGAAASPVWKITKDGKTLFIGGSIHILRKKDLPLPKQFERAFKQADILVFEADTSLVESPEIMEYLVTEMLLPNNQTLESILEPQTYKMLSNKCWEYGLPMAGVKRLKPAMVVTMLSVMQFKKLGFVEEGVDEIYLNKAKKAKKPVLFLESVQSQIDMIVTMGEGNENEFVQYSLQDFENTETQVDALVANWRSGAAEDEMLQEMKEEWPGIYQSLILNRHDAWLPQIVEFLAADQVHFIIVGNAHLSGHDGLFQRLKNIGCIVEPFM